MRRIEFRFSEIFPADDLLSEWLLTISMAANDLITVHDRMERDEKDEAVSFYWFRMAVAHFYEVGSHLHETRGVPEIRRFVDSLPEGTLHRYRKVLDVYTRRRKALSNIRMARSTTRA